MKRFALTAAAFLTMFSQGLMAGATEKLPSEIPPATLAKLIANSPKISALPTKLTTPLSKVEVDRVDRYYLNLKIGCYAIGDSCTFGSSKLKKTLVLLGDSHAAMWAPAIIPSATAAGYKVIVQWFPNCPVADVVPWVTLKGQLGTDCSAWRTRTLSAIANLNPSVVILSEATTFAQSDASTPFSPSAWQSALQRTFTVINKPSSKVIMMGDVPYFAVSPAQCLAAHPTDVQQCSTEVVNSIPQDRQMTSAESGAASATHIAFFNPDPLLCASTCSPIVGSTVTFKDTTHVASSYAGSIRGALWKGLMAAKVK